MSWKDRPRPFEQDYLKCLLRNREESERFFAIEAQALHELLPVPGARVLDVGFGAGEFLIRMRAEGAEAHGVEISRAACRHVRDRHPDLLVHPYDGDLDRARLEPASYDLVTFWDSLQYMRHPPRQLVAAHRLLRPGGALVVQVPSRDDFCLRYARGLHFIHPRLAASFLHIPAAQHLFPETTLRDLLDRTGFDVVRRRGHTPRWRPGRSPRWESLALDVVEGVYTLALRLRGGRKPLIVHARRRNHP